MNQFQEASKNMASAIATFSRAEALRFGWGATKPILPLAIPVLAIIGLLNAAVQLEWLSSNWGVVYLLEVVVPLGFVSSALNICENGELMLRDLEIGWGLLLRYLSASLLLALASMGVLLLSGIPLLLLLTLLRPWLPPQGIEVPSAQTPLTVLLTVIWIVPMYLLLIRYSFFVHFIVADECWGYRALRSSWKITRGNFGNLLLFYVLLAGVNLLGALCLIIGLFLTVPITFISQAFVFRKLTNHDHRNSA